MNSISNIVCHSAAGSNCEKSCIKVPDQFLREKFIFLLWAVDQKSVAVAFRGINSREGGETQKQLSSLSEQIFQASLSDFALSAVHHLTQWDSCHQSGQEICSLQALCHEMFDSHAVVLIERVTTMCQFPSADVPDSR